MSKATRMSETVQRIKGMIMRRMAGDESVEEARELDSWAAASPDNKEFVDSFMDGEQILRELKEFSRADKKEGLRRLFEKVPALADGYAPGEDLSSSDQ